MHLLTAQPGLISDGDGPVDLAQQPGKLLVLSAADTDLAVLSAAMPQDPFPSARLCSWLQLKHPFSVDAYLARMAGAAERIVVRLLGGKAYWTYGVEQLQQLASQGATHVYFMSGDDKEDPETLALNQDPEQARRLWTYLAQGGIDNGRQFGRRWRVRTPCPPSPCWRWGCSTARRAQTPSV